MPSLDVLTLLSGLFAVLATSCSHFVFQYAFVNDPEDPQPVPPTRYWLLFLTAAFCAATTLLHLQPAVLQFSLASQLSLFFFFLMASVLSYSDFRTSSVWVLPLYLGLAAVLLLLFFRTEITAREALYSGAGVYGVLFGLNYLFQAVLGKQILGGADVLYLTALALLSSVEAVIATVLLSAFLLFPASVVLAFRKYALKHPISSRIPYLPSLVISTILVFSFLGFSPTLEACFAVLDRIL